MTILIAQLYKENASVAQLITDMSVNQRVRVRYLKTAYFLWKPPPPPRFLDQLIKWVPLL